MHMKSLVSLAVLGAMSAVATAGDLVVFDKPNESYTVDGECQDFCVWGGYSRGSPTRLPFVFCDAVCQT